MRENIKEKCSQRVRKGKGWVVIKGEKEKKKKTERERELTKLTLGGREPIQNKNWEICGCQSSFKNTLHLNILQHICYFMLQLSFFICPVLELDLERTFKDWP